MNKNNSLLMRFYDKVILERPRIILFCLLAVIAFLGYKAKDFRLDASTETLILQTDKDFIYSRIIKSRYGSHDYLLLIYTPANDLFSDKSLTKLSHLRNELRQLKGISSVVSILDAPLLESSPGPVNGMFRGIETLESPTVDRRLAKIEFSKSPLYQNLLISPDLKTTALQIKLHTDERFEEMWNRRDLLRIKRAAGSITSAERDELKTISEQIETLWEQNKKTRHQDIAEIRAVMNHYRQDAKLFLGGVSMIADDMISFIKKRSENIRNRGFVFSDFHIEYCFQKFSMGYTADPLLRFFGNFHDGTSGNIRLAGHGNFFQFHILAAYLHYGDNRSLDRTLQGPGIRQSRC